MKNMFTVEVESALSMKDDRTIKILETTSLYRLLKYLWRMRSWNMQTKTIITIYPARRVSGG